MELKRFKKKWVHPYPFLEGAVHVSFYGVVWKIGKNTNVFIKLNIDNLV